MIYGYARISTSKQKIDRQIRNIIAKYPDAEIFKETYTGTRYYGRKELDRLLKKVQPGDTIVFDEVSRMSRNADEGVELYTRLYNIGVNLEFLREPQIDTDTYRQSVKTALNIDINTGDEATDEFMQRIIDAINEYTLALADRQIRMAFGQAQAEVDYLHQRTSEGIAAAKASGKRVGTPKGSTLVTKKSIAAKKAIQKYNQAFGGQLNDKETIKQIGINKNTFYKYKRELLELP